MCEFGSFKLDNPSRGGTVPWLSSPYKFQQIYTNLLMLSTQEKSSPGLDPKHLDASRSTAMLSGGLDVQAPLPCILGQSRDPCDYTEIRHDEASHL